MVRTTTKIASKLVNERLIENVDRIIRARLKTAIADLDLLAFIREEVSIELDCVLPPYFDNAIARKLASLVQAGIIASPTPNTYEPRKRLKLRQVPVSKDSKGDEDAEPE